MTEPTTGPAFVYMVRCQNGSLYTGWTDDLQKRLKAHQSGRGARYTRAFGAEGFAYTQRLLDKAAAQQREAALKALPKAEKEALAAAWSPEAYSTLRMARQGDTQAILDIYGWYVQHSTATLQWAVPGLQEYGRWVRTSRAAYPFLVAEDAAGRVIGFACAHRYHPRESFDWDAETTIYLAPGARGQGAAGPLYQALLALLYAQGCWRAYAVLADPNPRSEAFHTKQGFRCVCRLPQSAYKFGQWCGISTWALDLRPGTDPPAPVGPVPGPEVCRAALAGAMDGLGWRGILDERVNVL